jgi:hypothetical protein
VGKSKDFSPGIAIFQSHDRLLNQTTIPNRVVCGKFDVWNFKKQLIYTYL